MMIIVRVLLLWMKWKRGHEAPMVNLETQFTIYRLANTWVLFLGEDCDSQLKNSIEGIIIKWAYQVGRGSDLILSLSLLFLGGRGAQ